MPEKLRKAMTLIHPVGIALFAMSLGLPLVVNVKNFGITRLMFTALETQNVSHLLNACLRLVLMNTIRIAPTYLGALVIADRLTREGVSRFRGPQGGAFSRWNLAGWVGPVSLVPLVYMVIEGLYGIHYDFRMPALLSIITVIAVLKISRVDAGRNISKASLIVFQLVFAFQWLDIVPALTQLGFGHGEISWDLKAVADVLEAASLLNTFGLVASGILIFNGVISAKFMVDYQERLELAELEKKRSLELERMRTESLLARSYREMQALVHDLKTPLTTIQGLASVLAAVGAGTESAVHAQRISGAAERMNAMIRELMSEEARRRVAAAAFAKRLEANLPEEKTQGLVTISASQDLPDISINQTRMVRAVVNLIDNALDAGAAHVQVVFGSRKGNLEIVVKDDGTGMTEEALARCWEGGYSTKDSTGLGLMFVKHVVEEHGGTLFIKSAPGVGTECLIHIPVACGGEEDDKTLSSRR